VVGFLRRLKVTIIEESFTIEGERQHEPAIVPFCRQGLQRGGLLWRIHIGEGFSVIGNKSVPIDEAPYPVQNAIGHSRNHHSPEAVPDKYRVLDASLFQIFEYRIYGFRQADCFRVARSIAFCRRGVDIMSFCTNQGSHAMKGVT
jgi:hypothetical protein